jgi:RNA binding exosome subunit
MIKIAHNIQLTVFSYEEDDFDTVRNALLSLCPFSLEREKLSLDISTATGFNEKKIKLIKLFLKKEKHTNSFLTALKNALPEEQKNLLLSQLDSRLDSELNFFIRLNKPKLLNSTFQLTDSGDCFHIKMSVAAYPSKREVALKLIEAWLSSGNYPS